MSHWSTWQHARRGQDFLQPRLTLLVQKLVVNGRKQVLRLFVFLAVVSAHHSIEGAAAFQRLLVEIFHIDGAENGCSLFLHTIRTLERFFSKAASICGLPGPKLHACLLKKRFALASRRFCHWCHWTAGEIWRS